MFKNRIRTAALAGAIAVATGFSGVAVPAFAQEAAPTVNILNGWNIADGSEATVVGNENISEDELLAATDAVAEFIKDAPLTDVVAEYAEAGADGLDPSEEAFADRFAAAEEEAKAALADAVQNVADARASVGYALAADEAAAAAWDALDKFNEEQAKAEAAERQKVADVKAAVLEAVNGNPAKDIEGIIPALNESSKDGQINDEGELERLTEQLPPIAPLADAETTTIRAKIAELEARLKLVSQRDADKEYGNYVVRYYIPQLEKAIADLKGELAKVVAAEKALTDLIVAGNNERARLQAAAEAAQREAQKSDVLVRQYLLERAVAQRDTLRIAEALFAATERQVGLYESPENVIVQDRDGSNKMLRELYSNLTFTLEAAYTANQANLSEADNTAKDLFLKWKSDDVDYDNEADEYQELKEAYASDAWDAIRANTGWQEQAAYVQTIDNGVAADAAAAAKAAEEAKAKAEAEAKAAEEARQRAEAEAQRQQELNDLLKEALKEKESTPAPSEDGSASGSSTGLKIAGIIAAILGVIGLIAGAFPLAAHLGIKF